MIRLLIVDDHDVVRMGLKQVFSGRVDMEVAGEARTGEEAIAQVRATPYDVALVDLSLSDMSGVDVLNRAKAIRPEMAVLIVSGYPEDQYAINLLKAGASGFVAKDAPSENLVSAVVAAASAFLTLPAAQAACSLASGPKTAALVELYTSEGCSSCPPAEREIAHLRERLDADAQVVALAFHVGYWDYLGWTDRYAQPAFAARQQWLVRANGQRTLYTPQFFVSGAEIGARHAGLREEVRRVNQTAPGAEIRVDGRLVSPNTLAISAAAKAPASGAPLALYIALAESGLVSPIARGENAGATLEHDHVVRQWIGPVPLDAEGASARRTASLSWPPSS